MQVNIYLMLFSSVFYIALLSCIAYKYHKIALIVLMFTFIVPFILDFRPHIMPLVSASTLSGFFIVEIIKSIVLKFYFKSKGIIKEEDKNIFYNQIADFTLYNYFLIKKDNALKNEKIIENEKRDADQAYKDFSDNLERKREKRRNKIK